MLLAKYFQFAMTHFEFVFGLFAKKKMNEVFELKKNIIKNKYFTL